MNYINFSEQNKKTPRPWIKYYSKPELADLNYTDGSMYDVLNQTATDYPTATALDYMNTKTSYKALH
ncbi:MAG: hypothetical protein J6K12_01235, partial [Clostridia bacterium]|nr:hypothetical protein [Clostridia bacterium]